jgi:enoyl-CoA hydratase
VEGATVVASTREGDFRCGAEDVGHLEVPRVVSELTQRRPEIDSLIDNARRHDELCRTLGHGASAEIDLEPYEQLIYAVDGSVARVTLNRPAKLNAITQQLYLEFRHAITRAECDKAIEVILLTGSGRAFCAGGDLAEVNALHKESRAVDLAIVGENSSAAFRQMENISKPIVAMVNGLAHAAGCVLVMLSDIVIASEQASFRFPEALRGMAEPYAAGRLASLVGLARARYMMLTCAEIDARTAEQWGLVARVVPHQALEAEAAATIELILQTGQEARAWNKTMVNRYLPSFEPRALRMTISDRRTETGTEAFAR